MECVEKDAAAVEEECYYLAAAAVVIHDKLNREREGKKTKKVAGCIIGLKT